MKTGLLEILSNKKWMIRPDYVSSIRATIQQNLNGHIALADEEKVMCKIINARTHQEMSEDYLMGDGMTQPQSEQRDKFVSLLMVDGPITRNGGACSYGSRDLRDMLMSNATHPDCIGHIFYINTPGGSAWAKNDFQQAIQFAHEHDQPVIAYVDGMCCSAGMYLAALCDERYYMHPEDEIGCIGVMAAFYTEADGSKCEFTNETYHELYDPESFDKNREIRDIANDGNTDKLVAELAALGVEFRADVKKACPKATDDHLHGKVFAAKEVEGILMDGQKDLKEVFNRIVEISPAAKEPQASRKQTIITSPINNVNKKVMKEKFPALFAALAVEEMQMQEDGAFLNMGLLQTLNERIEALQQQAADAQALVDSLKGEHATAIENLNAEHQQAIDQLNTQLTTKGDELAAAQQTNADLTEQVNTLTTKADEQQTQINNLNTELNGAKQSLTTAQNTIAERDQQISDLNAQIEELQNDPGHEPQAGAQPHNNGGGADGPQLAVKTPVAKPGMTYEEMQAAWDNKD